MHPIDADMSGKEEATGAEATQVRAGKGKADTRWQSYIDATGDHWKHVEVTKSR